MIDQEEIHKQCLSKNPIKCIKALNQLRDNFSSLPDKQQAWSDLHELTNDKDCWVRLDTTSAIGCIYNHIPYKQQAWNDLIKLASDSSWSVRSSAASAICSIFSNVPDKELAWNDLHRLTNHEDYNVRSSIAEALVSVFSQVPDKQQAWSDLIRLTTDEHSDVRYKLAKALISAFSQVQDKQQAWNDLIRLTNDKHYIVRFSAAEALGSAFSQVRDKQQAWNDLIRLTSDEDSDMRSSAAEALGFVFSDVPDKKQAWNDLHRLTNDEEWKVRSSAFSSINSAFSQIPDKQQAWNDLIRLTKDWSVMGRAASALVSAFFQMPDKNKAWDDLIRLTKDNEWPLMSSAVKALGCAYSQIPDKQQAWNDLHRLTNDKYYIVRSSAAEALGSAFSQIPDNQRAWNDLIKLTNDEDSSVRSQANYSLGRVSIFMASQAEKEEEYREELEKAIEFFETAAKEASYDNSVQFCLPFYRSFYTIIFKRQETKEKVDKYLAEAKYAVRGSKRKELLFEAVENLANALKEVQNLENLDLETKKCELNFYRQYCDRAAELMRDTEETAPFATIAMRKGLPILDRNLKELLEEVQKKAKVACKEAKGTDTEKIACTINSEIQRWEIGSQEEMAFNVENLIFTLEANTPHNPQNGFILDRIKQIPEQKDVAKQYGMLSSIITLIIKSSSEQKLQEIGEKVDHISDKLEEITIFLKPGISEELIIHVGPITQWVGIEYTMSIPLQDISYPELKEDLQKIVGKKIDKLSKMPAGLANKVRDYLVQKKMWSILDKLT